MNKKKSRRNSAGYVVRRFLLLTEVLFVSLVFLGGSRITEEVRATSDMQIEEAEAGRAEEAAETADVSESKESQAASVSEFSWRNYKTIAHALGAMDGKTYLNAKESFISSYEKGSRLFEVDLVRTADGEWVCRHSWNQPLGQWDGNQKKVLTEKEFLSAPLYGQYTPMSLRDLLLLLKDYPDAYVLLDSKQYSVRNYLRTLEDYSEYVKIAQSIGAEEVLGQLIPEIYNEAMFSGTALTYRFPSYIYSLWQKYSAAELKEIAAFCKEKGIPAVTVYSQYWSENVQKIFDEQGLLVYIYTVNDLQEAEGYMKKGVDGICSDILLDADFETKKGKNKE